MERQEITTYRKFKDVPNDVLKTRTQWREAGYSVIDESKPDGKYYQMAHHLWISLYKLESVQPIRGVKAAARRAALSAKAAA